MLQFFKKIRHKLLSDKKFGRYLIYAVGEIVLVVIGILIALAINNSNQNRITREKEQIYLAGLNEEFEISKMKLTELMKVNEENIEGAREILKYTSQKDMPAEDSFARLLYDTFSRDISFNPNNSLLNEMISSGSLRDIQNDELRIQLTNWISTMEDVAKQEQDLALQREKVLAMFSVEETSLRRILDLAEANKGLGLPAGSNPSGNLKLLKSVAFENNVLMFYLSAYATQNAHYKPLLQDLNEILKLINRELK